MGYVQPAQALGHWLRPILFAPTRSIAQIRRSVDTGILFANVASTASSPARPSCASA